MRQRPGRVPATFDEFVSEYSRFIVWCIKKVSRDRVRQDDLPDLMQMIYLRVWEKNYLERCRELIAERGTGQFSTYLFWLVRSVLVNHYAKTMRSPLSRSEPIVRPSHSRGVRTGVDLDTTSRTGRYRDTKFEERCIAQDTLDRFSRYVETTKRGARLAQALQLYYEGYTAPEIAEETGLPRSQAVQARRELRAHFKAFSRAS